MPTLLPLLLMGKTVLGARGQRGQICREQKHHHLLPGLVYPKDSCINVLEGTDNVVKEKNSLHDPESASYQWNKRLSTLEVKFGVDIRATQDGTDTVFRTSSVHKFRIASIFSGVRLSSPPRLVERRTCIVGGCRTQRRTILRRRGRQRRRG